MAEPQRESWGNQCEFFLSSLGLAVGLGNIWRFPYICYINGGGSFLVPYLIALIFVGIPAFYIELSLGQYSRVGANKVFGRMVPAFNGLGYAMIFVRFFVNIYYVVITAWSLFYLFIGFQKNLPWGSCEEDWNTYDCYSKKYEEYCTDFYNSTDYTYYKKNCTTIDDYCKAHGYDSAVEGNCFDGINYTLLKYVIGNNSVSPAEDYFNGRVLGITRFEDGTRYDWENYGSLQWELVGCLAGAWALIFLSLVKGLQSYGKVAYVITLSPYVVLTALLIYSANLPGASNGLKYLFNPEWDKLQDVNIWAGAGSQILFSLSVAFGSQLVLSSYNSFKNNSQRDALIVGICNSATSLYAGVVVFLILGFLAEGTGSEVNEVVKGGISLAFVAYPSAVLEMDVSPLWSFLFFFMLINLALSSVCGGVQTFLAFILDEKPSLTKHRVKIVAGLCVLFFVAGTPMCTNSGILLFTVFDKRCTSSLLFLCLLEVVHVAWMYGTNKFFDNLAEMGMELNSGLKFIWTVLWKFITPVVLAFITVLAWVNHEGMKYDAYKFPGIVEGFGWVLELAPLAIVLLYPLIPFVKAWNEGFRGKDLMDELFSPTEKWYKTQMDRRTAEANEAIEAKFTHHNLAFDDKEDQPDNGGKKEAIPLEKLAYKTPLEKTKSVIQTALTEEIESLSEAAEEIDAQEAPALTPFEPIQLNVIQASRYDEEQNNFKHAIKPEMEEIEVLPEAPEIPIPSSSK